VRPFLLSTGRERSLLLRHQQTIGTHWSFVNMLVQRLGGREPGLTSRVELLEPLTARERSVMQLLPTMMSNAEIGEELYVSVNTVKVHLRSLYRKLGVRTRREAVARARDLGLVGALGPPPSAVDGGQPALAAGTAWVGPWPRPDNDASETHSASS
jgi:LuxR family transcriptional regulator, maltose regulon positive regulatory protein